MKAMVAGVLFLLSACGGGLGNEAGNASGNMASLANATDCPEDDLSCGRQRPEVSDGVTRFSNDNMYFSAIFPAGSQVCLTRWGTAPHGFFVVYGTTQRCPERPERPWRYIVLDASYNAPFYERVEDSLGGPCTPPSAGHRQRLSGLGSVFLGVPILLCETHGPGGNFEIGMHFLSGPLWDRGSRLRKAIYDFSLGTSEATFDEDLARFRRVLASVRIATRD